MTAPRLYIITDRRATGGRDVVAVVAEALKGAAAFWGLKGRAPVAVQLREKDLSIRDLLALARRMRVVTAAAGVDLFINDRVDVALAVGADGVHVPGGGLAVADIRAVAPHLRIGVSVHDHAQLQAASGADFVVFGPVFDTPSKQAVGMPGVGLSALAAVAKGPLPVVALGGITPDLAAACVAAGAAGIAWIRPVMGSEDPSKITAICLNCFKWG